MSFGIRIYNAARQLQIHEDYLVPEMIGKITTVASGNTFNQGGELGLEYRDYYGAAPDFGGHDVMIFWSLPEGVYWTISDNFALASASGGANFGAFAYCLPGTVISGAPVGYVFSLGSVRQSSEQFGARVWSAAGSLLFDSGRLSLSPHQAPLISYPFGSDATVTLDRTLPAKPAFLLPRSVRIEDTYDGTSARPDDVSHMRRWWGAIKISSGVVQTRFLLVKDMNTTPTNSGSVAGYAEDYTYGNTSGMALPIINAANYD